jgi:hypothetical protein
VQAPTKYETVMNLKMAKALGLTMLRGPSWPPTRSSNEDVICWVLSPVVAHRCRNGMSAVTVSFGGKADIQRRSLKRRE